MGSRDNGQNKGIGSGSAQRTVSELTMRRLVDVSGSGPMSTVLPSLGTGSRFGMHKVNENVGVVFTKDYQLAVGKVSDRY
jgi:hypothetical protein